MNVYENVFASALRMIVTISLGEYNNFPFVPTANGFTTVGFGLFAVDFRIQTCVGVVDEIVNGGCTYVFLKIVLLNCDPFICPLGWVV